MGLLLLFARSPRRFSIAYALFRNERVPLQLKLIAVAATLFILSPLNILGDIPLVGLFDDAALLALLLSWFVRTAGPFGDVVSDEQLVVVRSSNTR